MIKFSIEKCKNFGYTFSFLSFLLGLFMIIFDTLNFIPLTISLFLFLIAYKLPYLLKYPGYIWEQFGIILGKFISPLILTAVYVITVIPINIFLRLFSIDILNRKVDKKKKSYWIDVNKRKTNFNNQY